MEGSEIAASEATGVQLNRSFQGIPNRRAGIQPAPDFYECIIEKAENGFILRFCCKSFVATTWEEAAEGLGEYYTDPVAAQKKYIKA